MYKNFILLALLSLVVAQNTIQLLATVRDFTPNPPHKHPDFEAYLGNGRGAVLANLDGDGKPVLSANPADWSGVFTGVSYFAEWYRDTAGININIPLTLTLTETAPGSGVFAYSNTNYFPIDGQGWGNYGSTGHNFHFTTEIHTTFTYQGGEVFNFEGDDDLFVFINGKLAIDLGGVHGPEDASVSLDAIASNFGLVIGQDATLAIFGAERHTSGSNFIVSTSIRLIPVPPTPTTGRTVWLCGVRLDNFGVGLAGPAPQDPTFSLFGNSPSSGFDNFNAVSFGSFVVTSNGDIQGRLAVRHNAQATGGYSVGASINSAGPSATDRVLPFSFVVGGNANLDNMGIYPDGSNQNFFSQEEDLYVGGVLTAPQYLQQRRKGGPAPGALEPDFTNALAYYTELSNEFAAKPANTQYGIADSGGLQITCNDNTGQYYINIPDTDFNTVNYFKAPIGCLAGAQFVFNILGVGNVTFPQDQQRFSAPEYVVYNIPGAGRWVSALNQPEGSILCPGSSLYQPVGTIVGNVYAGDIPASHQINRLFCPAHAPSAGPSINQHLCPAFESDCAGLLLPLGSGVFSFRDFNVISFGDFVDNAGDVQGRLAVQNNLVVSGFSVGHELQTQSGIDNDVPFALVVGGDATFNSGSVFPDGTNIPFPGNAEGIYVGGTFTAPQYLQLRRTGGPGSIAGYFNSAHQCYNTFANNFGNLADNVQQSIQYGGLLLHCNSNTDSFYSVTVPDTTFNAITYYVLDNCNFQAAWVVNIGGNGAVNFYGGSFPAVAGGLVYNVLGSGRLINVTGTGVTGHILAPNNILTQTASVIVGKVVVGSIPNLVQVNKPVCTSPPPVQLFSFVAAPASTGASIVSLVANPYIPGDILNIGGQTRTVTGINGKVVTVNSPLTGMLSAGSVVSATVDGTNSRVYIAQVATSTHSGSSSIQIFFALVVALIAFVL